MLQDHVVAWRTADAARSAAQTQLKIESLGTEEYRHAPPHLVALPRREITRNVAHMTPDQPRRAFLKTAGAIATGIAASTLGCAPSADRNTAANPDEPLDRALLHALADVTLPDELGTSAKQGAVDAFVAWINAYEPVAEEMHGYGYADVRYLPADPAPAWQAQLRALDTLAQKTKRSGFAKLGTAARRDVLAIALRGDRGDRLPAPLSARHVAVALVAHWASTPAAWNMAMGVDVSPGACRPLDGATRKPLPIAKA